MAGHGLFVFRAGYLRAGNCSYCRVLGPGLGFARAVGAILFSVIIGLLMHLIFRKEEIDKANAQMMIPEPEEGRPYATALYFATMVAILVFANWGQPLKPAASGMHVLSKWIVMAWPPLRWRLCSWSGSSALWKVVLAALPAAILALLFRMNDDSFAAAVFGLSTITSIDTGESGEWFSTSWALPNRFYPYCYLASWWPERCLVGSDMRADSISLGQRPGGRQLALVDLFASSSARLCTLRL